MKTTTHFRLFLSAMTVGMLLYGCGGERSKTNKRSYGAGEPNDDDAVGITKKPYKKPIDDHAHEPTIDPVVEPPVTQEPQAQPEPEPEVKEVAALTSAVGIKNFRQINATMSALTTIPTTNAVVAPVYAQLTTQLPDGNDIRTFLPSHQVAIAKLAVEYCDQMVVTPTAVAVVLPGIALNQTPATALNTAGRDAINKALIGRFWGSGRSDIPDMAESLATLSKLTDELLAGKNLNNAALTPNIVKGLCTAVLSSGPVTFQ